MSDSPAPVEVFISYAHEDELLRQQLEAHLSPLRRQGLISDWHDRKILAGDEWAPDIDEHLETASIILLLISPDFFASDYCFDIEMPRALERHKLGDARVIPIILRPVDWRNALFGHLQCLPQNGKPVTEWDNQDRAFQTIVEGLRSTIEKLHRDTYSPSASSTKIRQRLLQRVYDVWIAGVLESSFHYTDFITLNIQEQPDAIDNVWKEIVQETKRSPKSFPPDTQMLHVYDTADGELLILGEPGAGKTTQLLELTRNLLNRAKQDAKHPIPVIFHLSDYYDECKKNSQRAGKSTSKEIPLAKWLIEELSNKYNVPRNIGEALVTNDQILPLLDGLDEGELDEGKIKYQDKCIEAINAWKKEHDFLPLVICGRSSEYMSQKNRLRLKKAVTIQPLTISEIEAYLARKGESFESLLLVLHRDSQLRAVVSTPLMLNILVLAYKENKDLFGQIASQKGSVEERRKQIFEVYMQKMLSRRGSNNDYTPNQVIFWLSVSAKWSGIALTLNESIFLDPLPKWFPFGWQRRVYEEIYDHSTFIEGAFLLALLISLLVGIRIMVFPSITILSLIRLFFETISNTMLLVAGFRYVTSGGEAGKVGSSKTTAIYACVGYILILPTIIFFPPQKVLSELSSLPLAPILIILSLILLNILSSLRKFIARALLHWSGWMPWNYRKFLDYAVERILLRKEGGEYAFIHALLRDYFSSLDTSSFFYKK
jgi:DNA polymerase III delta prime subunit